jgi:hypothetical protein
MALQSVNLILSDARGVYIPRDFAEGFATPIRGEWLNLDPRTVATCAAGPDVEWYWDAWQEILDRAQYRDTDGKLYSLHQDGDLWLICYDDMTAEERRNFDMIDDVTEY